MNSLPATFTSNSEKIFQLACQKLMSKLYEKPYKCAFVTSESLLHISVHCCLVFLYGLSKKLVFVSVVTGAHKYCIGGSFHQEKSFASTLATYPCWQNFLSAKFFFSVNEHIEDMATFTALAKIYSTDQFPIPW